YPTSTKTPDGNYLVLFTESEQKVLFSEWAFLYQFKILYHFNPISSIDDNKQSLTELKIFPNPATQQIFIPLDRSNENQILIYNELGQLVFQTTSPKEFGSNFFNINIESLHSGMYKCIILTSNEKQVANFVKN
ncbi:MAG: T9SS type A sorting domain-containing protein, partial [Bacteroidales bacterium]